MYLLYFNKKDTAITMTSELIFFYNNHEEFWISLLIQIKSKPYNAMTVFLCYFGGGGAELYWNDLWKSVKWSSLFKYQKTKRLVFLEKYMRKWMNEKSQVWAYRYNVNSSLLLLNNFWQTRREIYMFYLYKKKLIAHHDNYTIINGTETELRH